MSAAGHVTLVCCYFQFCSFFSTHVRLHFAFMTAFVALAVIGHHDGRLPPNTTDILREKSGWRFSDTTMAYCRQSRQKYFMKFFYKIFFSLKFFSRYFSFPKIFLAIFCNKFLSIVNFSTFHFLLCWRFSDTIVYCVYLQGGPKVVTPTLQLIAATLKM